MRGVNKVIVLGNVGQDPELKNLPSGSAVCNVSIATTERWKDKQSGESKEATEWHRVTFYGRLAEIAAEYLRKGAQAYVEGSLRTRKWQDKSGADRYTTEIIAAELQLLGKGDGQRSERPAQAKAPAQQQASDRFVDDDDIPFAFAIAAPLAGLMAAVLAAASSAGMLA